MLIIVFVQNAKWISGRDSCTTTVHKDNERLRLEQVIED